MDTPAVPTPDVPRPPSDWGRLAVLLLLAVGLRAYTVPATTVPSRDCIVFVRDGLQLETPPDGKSRHQVVQEVEHPPGYPAAIVAMSWLVRPASGPTVETMALSAQLVSALAAVLLVFPMYRLVRHLFDRNTAFAAVALFQVLPVFVEVTSDGISDGLFLLTAAWALWFGVRALDRGRSVWGLPYGLAAGLCCGAGYWIRPDAAVVGTALGLTLAGVVVWRIRTGGSRRPFLAGAGLIIGTLAFVGPFVVTTGKLTNKKTGGAILEWLRGKGFDPTYFDRNRDRSSLPGVSLPLAVWWDPTSTESKPWWALKGVGSEYAKAAHYAIPAFGLIGLIALRRRLTDPRITLLVLTGAVHLTILWLMAWKADYVSQRHTLLTVLVTCIFAAASLPLIGAWCLRGWRPESASGWTPWQLGAVLAGLLMTIALPRDFRSLHSERAGHKAAGEWLRQYGDPNVPVVDPFGWAEWYAGRSMYRRNIPDVTRGPVLYAVFEPNAKSPHSRLFLYTSAGELAEKGEIVYRYPPDAPPDKIKVAVYKAPPLLKQPD